jgi:hypothetical protein
MTHSRMKMTRLAALLGIAVLMISSAAAVAATAVPRGVVGTVAKKGGGSSEPSSSTPTSADPCKYVPAHNAAAIFHVKVKETEAPLGPTCIFTVKGKKQTDTLAVEVLNVTQTVRKMKHVSKFKLAGHSGYCGDLGTPQLLVKLRHSKVLSVHAPCSTARALAGVAISRIKT